MTGTVVIASAVLAFLLATVLPALRSWRRRRRERVLQRLAAAPPSPIAIAFARRPHPTRPPKPAPTPPRQAPRRHPLRVTPGEARRAIALMAVLGPCRAESPYR
jgi:hypothetical protein